MNFVKVKRLTFLICTLLSFPNLAFASPQNVIKDNGTARTVEIPAGPLGSDAGGIISCRNIIAMVEANHDNAKPPSLSAIIQIGTKGQTVNFEVPNIAQNQLENAHIIRGLKLGCLSQDGGVGIYIPHANGDEKALFIQIDNEGMVHFGYNLISLEIIESAAE